MKPKPLAAMALALFVMSECATVATAGSFTDGFEGPALDPFWSKTEISGSIVFPGTSLVNSGSQSVEMSTIDTGANKFVFLTHDFGAPVYGHVSVSVFDVGADRQSGNYLELELADSMGNRLADIRTQDYDLGPGVGDTYLARVESIGELDTGIDRTQSWHQWDIDTTPISINLYVDGQNVYSTAANIPFSQLSLNMFAPSWRPALTAAWDDFSVRTDDGTTTPEPGSLTLLGIGLCIFWGARRRLRTCGSFSSLDPID